MFKFLTRRYKIVRESELDFYKDVCRRGFKTVEDLLSLNKEYRVRLFQLENDLYKLKEKYDDKSTTT